MTPAEREQARETERQLAASALRVGRAADRARLTSALIQPPLAGVTALLVHWQAWPWLPLPLAAAFGVALAAREIHRRALERHKRTCSALGVTIGS